MKQLLAILATMLMFLSGVLTLLNPFWWTQTKVNPLSRVKVSWSLVVSIAFRLEIVIQNTFNFIFSPLRNFWTNALVKSHEVQEHQTLPLDEFDWKNNSFDKFFSDYQKAQKPVVLRNFLTQSKNYESWNLEEIIKAYGEEEVILSCPIKDGYKGKLKDIDIPGVYLHNSETLLNKYPHLLEKMGFDLLAEKLSEKLKFSGVIQLFAGRKKTGTWWHCAGGINFFSMLEGQKKWTFINPAYSPLLFPKSIGAARSSYYISEVGASSKVYKSYLDNLKENDRGVIFEKQNNELFKAKQKLFDSVPRFEVVLNPGDALLIPAWWWHDVENLSDHTIGVASRWFDSSRPTLANNLFDIGTRLNPSFFYTAISGLLKQKIVKNGKLVLSSSTKDGFLTFRTRANGLDKYAPIDESIQEYYKRFNKSF